MTTIYLEALHVLERIDRGAAITSLTPDELMIFAGAVLHLQHVGLRYVAGTDDVERCLEFAHMLSRAA